MKTALPLMALVILTGCQGMSKTRTTTTRMGITGAQETVVVETPYVDPWDAMMAEAGRELMQTQF